MGFQSVEDAELLYLSENPHLLLSFINAEPPMEAPALWKMFLGAKPRKMETPIPWPTSERPCMVTEITHRSVEIFHYLLNGTYQHVGGCGDVFESWFRSRSFEGITIPAQDAAFGYLSADVPHLAQLLDGMSEEVIALRWKEYSAESDSSAAGFYDVEFFSACFSDLRRICQMSLDQSKGLMWVVC